MKRVILGKRSSEYGLWVSKPNASADSTDPDDFLFEMANITKRVMQGTVGEFVQYTTAGIARYEWRMSHGLGYAPAVLLATSAVEPVYFWSSSSEIGVGDNSQFNLVDGFWKSTIHYSLYDVPLA